MTNSLQDPSYFCYLEGKKITVNSILVRDHYWSSQATLGKGRKKQPPLHTEDLSLVVLGFNSF